MSLANARKARDGCREQLAQGIDPGVARKAQAAAQSSRDANSFEVVAREWLKEHVDPKSESHSKRVYARFDNDVLPIRIPSRLAPFTRRMPAARSGLSNPLSDASYANRRTAARRRLIVAGAKWRASR